jgi:hypothetical protein
VTVRERVSTLISCKTHSTESMLHVFVNFAISLDARGGLCNPRSAHAAATKERVSHKTFTLQCQDTCGLATVNVHTRDGTCECGLSAQTTMHTRKHPPQLNNALHFPGAGHRHLKMQRG